MPCLPRTVKEILNFTQETFKKTCEDLAGSNSCERTDVEDIVSDVLFLAMLGDGVPATGPPQPADQSNCHFDAANGPVFRQLEDWFNEFTDPHQALTESIYITSDYRVSQIKQSRKDPRGAFRIPDINNQKQRIKFSFKRRFISLHPQSEEKADVNSEAALFHSEKQSVKEWEGRLKAEKNEGPPLSQILSRLPPRQRQVSELKLAGFNQKQIAAKLGISEAGVSLNMTAAKERLKKELTS
jgi:hypothetical protein